MDRRPLVIAVFGAVATLAVVALLLAIPAADRCAPSGRDLWSCLRDSFSERYMPRGAPAGAPARADVPATKSEPIDILVGVPDGPATTIDLAPLAADSPAIGADLPPPPTSATPAGAPPASADTSPQPSAPPAADPPPTDAPAPSLPPETPVIFTSVGPGTLSTAAPAAHRVPVIVPLLVADEPAQRPAPAKLAAPASDVPPPTIDIIAFDGSGRVEGEGPEGARIQLFIDDVLAGAARVEHGRWALDGVNLGTKLTLELRVDAFDALNGAPLGSSTFTIEIDLPAQPNAGLSPAAAVIEQVADLDPSPQSAPPPATDPEPAASEPPDASPAPPPAANADSAAAPSAAPSASPAASSPPQPAATQQKARPAATPPAVRRPGALPPLRPVSPRTTSPSVTLLQRGNTGSIMTLGGD